MTWTDEGIEKKIVDQWFKKQPSFEYLSLGLLCVRAKSCKSWDGRQREGPFSFVVGFVCFLPCLFVVRKAVYVCGAMMTIWCEKMTRLGQTPQRKRKERNTSAGWHASYSKHRQQLHCFISYVDVCTVCGQNSENMNPSSEWGTSLLDFLFFFFFLSLFRIHTHSRTTSFSLVSPPPSSSFSSSSFFLFLLFLLFCRLPLISTSLPVFLHPFCSVPAALLCSHPFLPFFLSYSSDIHPIHNTHHLISRTHTQILP